MSCGGSVSSGSQVTPIDKKAAQDFARQARRLAKKDLLELAGSENIELWQQVIANRMQQHQGHKVSLLQLQQALGMPLVEVWLGLLHSPTAYRWEGKEEFYLQAQDVWIYDCSNLCK